MSRKHHFAHKRTQCVVLSRIHTHVVSSGLSILHAGSISCMQVLLCRTNLRRSAHRFWVKSLLYIPPERSSGPEKPLGQVDPTHTSLQPYTSVSLHHSRNTANCLQCEQCFKYCLHLSVTI